MSWLRADTRIRMRMGISWTNTPSPPWREEPMVTPASPGWGSGVRHHHPSSPSSVEPRWREAVTTKQAMTPLSPSPIVPPIQRPLHLPPSPDKNQTATGVKYIGERMPKNEQSGCLQKWGQSWRETFTTQTLLNFKPNGYITHLQTSS